MIISQTEGVLFLLFFEKKNLYHYCDLQDIINGKKKQNKDKKRK